MPDDARDLYRAMRLADEQVKDRIEVSEVYLAGYSLGGTHAAWVANLDEQERAIGFDKVLLLNPAVSLYNLVNALDAMYDRHVADDPAAQALIAWTFTRFAEASIREQEVTFDGDFLYRAYQEFQPGTEALETLIGTSFRYPLVNLAFTADVIGKGGYMVPPDAELGTTTSLTDFYKHAFRKSFVDYLDGLYLPYFQRLDPALTRERAIHEAGLLPLGRWLEGNPRIGVITNRDDIILKPEELAWLERTFGAQAVVLPNGGHYGNN
jgi:pimeloyl-ACP methyl ester carboxylesterase